MELSKVQQAEELTKICANLFEFLKFVKIQEPGELTLDYQLWPHLIQFYRDLEAYKLIDLIKSKKVGISWALAIYGLWQIMTIPGWRVLEISKGMVEAQELLSKSKIVYQNLPDWITKMPVYHVPKPNSSEQFGFEALGSVIHAFPSTETAGVGETAGLVIHDESDFHDFYEINLSHTRATVADTKGGHLVSVSTVDITKPDSYFKRHWKAGEGSGYPEAGANGFKSLFMGVFSRPGRDEAFYNQMVRENEATPWVVKANYPRTIEEALSPLSAQSCFSKDRLDNLWYSCIEAPETRQGCIYILHPPRVGVRYAAGADVGEGGGLNYSCLTIVGTEGLTSEVVAVIYTNTVGTDSFAYDVDGLCREYFKPLLCIDNIGIGKAVADKLVELGYPNLYYSDTKRQKVGWALTRPNKRELVVKLVESINNSSLITKFKPQVKELMEYQWINGYPEPTGKTHGDTVISLMFANRMLKEIGGIGKASMYVDGRKIW